ncbi:MAG TPA: AGE family epimerase/isomerase [Nakamurella sp.]
MTSTTSLSPVSALPVQIATNQIGELLAFGARSRLADGGFGWLDDHGNVATGHSVQTWITARMTYVFALADLQGWAQAGPLVDHGVAALRALLRDDEFGGWFAAAPSATTPSGEGITEKRAYDTAFVLLAASAATAAGRPSARALLQDAITVMEERFWSETDGLALDVRSGDWAQTERYRGANANMHMVEAFLAAGDVTGDAVWHQRALGIADRLIHGTARDYHWRLPEHFDEQWRPLPDYNRDEPAHPFRPPGATIGHGLEWSRLLAHLHLALAEPPGWLLTDARAYYRASVDDGWAADGADGFVYTVDFGGSPMVRQRMHWVVAEAIGAAALLHKVLGEPAFDTDLQRWWRYADRYLIDHHEGGWRHELDPGNRPDGRTWAGKPDVYHAYQAALLTTTRPSSTLITALA